MWLDVCAFTHAIGIVFLLNRGCQCLYSLYGFMDSSVSGGLIDMFQTCCSVGCGVSGLAVALAAYCVGAAGYSLALTVVWDGCGVGCK